MLDRIGRKMANQPKFKVSIPPEYSRAVKRPSLPPPFQIKHFTEDIKALFEQSNSQTELQENAVQIINHYVWPCTSFAVLHRHSEDQPFKLTVFSAEGVTQIRPEDLGLGSGKNGLIEHIIRTGRTAYIPDAGFNRCPDYYHLPLDVQQQIGAGKFINMDVYEDVVGKGFDLTPFRERIAPHSKSLIIKPIKINGLDLGLFVAGFEKMLMFDEAPFNSDHVLWMHMLADAAGQTLDKLQSQSQK